MNCTGCKRNHGEYSRDDLEAAGWFVWRADAHVRYHGVVLCPACRRRAHNEDAFGGQLPTAELEAAASRPAAEARP